MGGLFYNLGKFVGPKVRKGKWLWKSIAADEAEILQAEHEVGRDMAAALADQMPPDREVPVRRLIDEVGRRLASRLTSKARRFTFQAVKVDVPNAWALPGGFIFITRALVDLCESHADEVAFVLGHEMGHVVRGHAMDRMLNSTLLSAASRVTPVGRVLTPRVMSVGLKLVQSAYSQDQELEADAFGVRLCRSAGYDTTAALQMMQRLAQAAGESADPSLWSYFGTHPALDERMAHLQRVISNG